MLVFCPSRREREPSPDSEDAIEDSHGRAAKERYCTVLGVLALARGPVAHNHHLSMKQIFLGRKLREASPGTI